MLSFAAYLTLTLAPPAAAQLDDPLRYFATCTGRLSAQMEHEWLMQDDRSSRTEAQRATLVELLHSVFEPHRGREVLAWRIEAKMAHSALLTQATFQEDDWAARRAIHLVRECTSILIS